jgi:glycosyltransferase involved in cell wall biosynthesis
MRIAFVSPTSAGLFAETLGYTGGAEVQQYLLAQALSRRGHEPVFVVADRPGLRVSPIRYIPAAYPLSARHILERAAGTQALWQALARADAAVYVQQGAGAITLETALFARATGRAFVYVMASDDDWSGALGGSPLRLALFRLGARRATAIVTQTERQREQVLRRWGLAARVIRGGVRVPERPGGEARERALLWVGTIRWHKRPDRLLDLAARLPDVAVWVVGGPWIGDGSRDAQTVTDFRARAASLPNVRWHGLLSNEEVLRLQRRAALLVNTSDVEGFPQTFLEAWACGTPVVTCGVDPDEVLCRHGLGIHAAEPGDLVSAALRLLDDEPLRRQMGKRAYDHVQAHHDLERVADDYTALFASLAGEPGACADGPGLAAAQDRR